MSRLKTIAFWIFVALALSIAVYAYLGLKNNKKPHLNALSVIPDSCLVYLNTSDFSGLNTKINERSLIADKLKLFGDIEAFCNTLKDFDSLVTSDEDLKKELEHTLIHFAYYENPDAWLLTFNIRQLGEQESIRKKLIALLKVQKQQGTTCEFRLTNNHAYFFTLNDGVFLLANTEAILNKALENKGKKLENNSTYLDFKNTVSENNTLSIFVNQHLYTKSKARKKLDLCCIFERGYSAGAIEIQPSQIKINGYSNPDTNEIIFDLKNQDAQRTDDLFGLLPGSTIYFKAMGFSSYPNFYKKLNSPEETKHFWKLKNDEALYNLEKDFIDNIATHLLEMDLEGNGNKIIVAEIQDSSKAREHLILMSDTVLTDMQPLIYQLPVELKLFSPIYGNSTHYACLYASHLFFSNSYASLSSAIKELQYGNLLIHDESFAFYKNQHFTDSYNYLIYCAPDKFNYSGTFFHFKKETSEIVFKNFKHLFFSLNNDESRFKFRFHLLNESEKRTKEQNTLWTLNLDTVSTNSAAKFVNHISGENEVVIQDEKNVLYLINAKGKILWKKQINEKILSEISMVDIYKKNKYQLLFNTKNYLHLIDRNGNYVEEYPVKLPAEASNSMSLFDYEGDKEYRLFIACVNKTIYNFSIHGEKQEKFSPVKTDEEVNLPIQYVKVGASDYLVALDKEGKIYTFSRKGIGRIGLKNKAVANCSAFYTDAANAIATTRFIYVDDKNGMLNKISFDDKKEISKLTGDIENAHVQYNFVDENRSMDLILTKDNSIMAFDFNGNLIFEKTAPFLASKSTIFNDESHSVIYALNENRDEIFLFDQQKQSSKILKGNSLPTICNLFNDNKKYLIVTNGNRLSCLLLN